MRPCEVMGAGEREVCDGGGRKGGDGGGDASVCGISVWVCVRSVSVCVSIASQQASGRAVAALHGKHAGVMLVELEPIISGNPSKGTECLAP